MDFVGAYAIRAGLSAIAYHQTSNFFIKCVAAVFAARASSDYSSQGDMGLDEAYDIIHRNFEELSDSDS